MFLANVASTFVENCCRVCTFWYVCTSTTACGGVGSFKSRAYNPEENVLVETSMTTASHLLVSSHLLTPFFR